MKIFSIIMGILMVFVVLFIIYLHVLAKRKLIIIDQFYTKIKDPEFVKLYERLPK